MFIDEKYSHLLNKMPFKDENLQKILRLSIAKMVMGSKKTQIEANDTILLTHFLHGFREKDRDKCLKNSKELSADMETIWDKMFHGNSKDIDEGRVTLKSKDFKDGFLQNTAAMIAATLETEFGITHNVDAMWLMWSKAKCRRQQAHRDAKNKTALNGKNGLQNTSYTWIYTFHEGSSIHIYDKSIEGPEKMMKIELPVNSLFLFKGHIIHAGSNYDKDNFRLLGQVESKTKPAFTDEKIYLSNF
jgi:hypothetical protein